MVKIWYVPRRLILRIWFPANGTVWLWNQRWGLAGRQRSLKVELEGYRQAPPSSPCLCLLIRQDVTGCLFSPCSNTGEAVCMPSPF